jgi:hypothetical protein
LKFPLYATAIGILALMPGAANASVIAIDFVTSGTFSAGTPAELTYTPTTFTGTTSAAGFLDLPDLGQFGLSIPADPQHFNGQTFTLHLDFSSPLGIVGSVDFMGAITGHVSGNSNSKLHINFTPNSQSYNFANASGTGSFTLTVNDIIGLQKDSTSALTGSISNAVDPSSAAAATPEPASWMLLVGGALVLVHRRARMKVIAS